MSSSNQKKYNDDDSQTMPPPPSINTAESSFNSPAAAALQMAEDRHMNDTTMPPPKRVSSTGMSMKKTPAVNPRSRRDRTGGGPGFGLHDWKRLLMVSKDLAQLQGQPPRRNIPLEEIRQHNKNYDAWIILRGRVYNIGPYLPYHPGGVAIFKNVLGKDATSMFDKYHRWVNIDGLIGSLMIGTAATGPSQNSFSVVPPKESHLINAPRVPVKSTGLLTLKDEDEEEDEEDFLLSSNIGRSS
jgi:cytochrome b involved in lipid metabolism